MDFGYNLRFHAKIVRPLQKLATLINLATHKRNFFPKFRKFYAFACNTYLIFQKGQNKKENDNE